MAGAPSKDFVKEIEGDAEGVKSKLKKTTTAEKTWTPTADGASFLVPLQLLALYSQLGFSQTSRPTRRSKHLHVPPSFSLAFNGLK